MSPTERSLRPPPLSGPSCQSKGKQPVRVNPQFEAYHNPYKILPEPEQTWLESYLGDVSWWLKPLLLLLTVGLMVAFVVFCPPPGYESEGGHRDPAPNAGFRIQPLDGGDQRLRPETWAEAPTYEGADVDAQRVFRIVHRPR